MSDEIKPIDNPLKRILAVWLMLVVFFGVLALAGCSEREPEWMGHCLRYGVECDVG